MPLSPVPYETADKHDDPENDVPVKTTVVPYL